MGRKVRHVSPGTIFGKWTVLGYGPLDQRGYIQCKCLCECGKIYLVGKNKLTIGRSSACVKCSEGAWKEKHGLSKDETYKVWDRMHANCSPQRNNNKRTRRVYVDRGIKVCDRWDIYKNFLEDMGPRKPNYALHRINTHDNFSPSNCEWRLWNYGSRNKKKE